MSIILKIGSKVRLRFDDGWGSPGCVMAPVGEKLRIYWPDENVFTCERPVDLVLYGSDSSSQPHELVA